MLSVVIPSLNEEENIQNTSETISRILDENGIDFEIIFVDDGSRDGTWSSIQVAHGLDGRVYGLRFSRNFGKEAAITAGLNASRGDCAVVLDCDLQHPPAKIPEMYRLWQNGAEVVEGKKSSRGEEGILYKLLTKLFYKLIPSRVMNMDGASDFKLLDRKAIDAVLSLGEREPFFRAVSGWVGFRSETVTYDVAKRVYGQKKWTASMLLRYAANNLTAFSFLPLYISGFLGGVITILSVILAILKAFGIYLGSFYGSQILILLTGGLILLSLSIIGRYLSLVLNEVRARPRYIISESLINSGGKHD